YQCRRSLTASRQLPRRGFYSSSLSETLHSPAQSSVFAPLDTFARRHIGPSPSATEDMLKILDPPAKSLDEFVRQVLPANILSSRDLKLDAQTTCAADDSNFSEEGFTESQLVTRLKEIASKNKVFRSYIGCGYAGTRVPEV